MDKPIKSGVIIEEPTAEDWLLGDASFGKEILVSDGDWSKYLPSKEKQRQGFESMACTNFSSTSAIEIYFNFLIKNKRISVGNLDWLTDKGYFDKEGSLNFSDRFDAIVSGTTSSGNSLKNPAQAKHKYGLIPDKMLPWTDNRSEYFDKNKIAQEWYTLGQEFLLRFPINYERVSRRNFAEALKYSPLAGAVFAWNGVANGVYYKVDSRINHAICIFEPPKIWQIWDSYDPFIKKLADNYIFLNYAYRYIIQENVINEPSENDMLQTIKAQSDPRIFIQSNTNAKKLIWINDIDNTAWLDYQRMISYGWIPPEPKIIGDSLLASYEIEPFRLNGDLFVNPDTNPFGLWRWIKSLFGK